MTPSAARLAAAGCACLFVAGLIDNVRGPLLPRIVESFTASQTQASLLVGIGSLSGGPGSLAAGVAIARLGARVTLALACAILAAGVAAIAAGGFSGTFLLVPAGAAGLGFGISALGVLANFFVASATTAETRAKALSGLHVLYATASVIVPLGVVGAMERLGWPAFLLGLAGLPVLLGAGAAALPRVDAVASDAPRAGPAGGGRTIAVHAAAIALFVVAEVTVSMWLITFFKDAVKEPAVGPRNQALFFVGLGAARALGGALLRPANVRAVVLVAGVASAAATLAGLHGHPGFLALEGLTIGIVFPAAMASLTFELPAEQHGRAMGIVAGVYSLLLALSHTTTGLVADAWGIRAALHLSPAAAVAGVVVLGVFGRGSATRGAPLEVL